MSDNFCLPAPCPVVLSSTCVFYEGENLVYIGVNTGDSLEVALQKINGKIQDTAFGYIFRNGIEQPVPGGPVVLGGSLIQNTTITGAYNVNFTQANLGAVKFVTAGGTSSQYVKGDGSLDGTSLQPAGNYITALSGDGSATGPGSVTFTLNTVNNNPGTYGSSTSIPQITVDAKGRVTAVTPVTVYIPSGSLSFTGDVSGSGNTGSTTTLTLNTVNSDVYTNNTFLKFTVNGKGLVTAATPVVVGDIETVLGYTPVTNARTITINGVTYDLTADRSWSVGTVTSVGVSAGAGISASVLNPNDTPVISITNTAPDQIVGLTAGDGINITGIYPNFTVSNSASYMSLQGDWNAATNTPNLTSGPITTGYAWRVSVDGNTDLDGITDWKVGDLAVKSATGWIKIDNSDTITSVFGRVGAISAQNGDYNTDLVTEAINNLYFTTSRARQSISGSGPINYSDTTGIISINQSSGTTDGYLSSTDWSTFYNKENAISPGITTQVWRGDKTWQTIDTVLGYTPANAATTLTINGTTYDLTNNRSWSVGTVTSVGLTSTAAALSITNSPITSSGNIAINFAGNSGQYVSGDGNLVNFPSIITQAQNLVTEVYNETGATLTKGTVVYINGGHGNLPTVTKAIATSDATSAQTYGIVRANITNNNNGYVTVIGNLDNMDTQAYPNGTQLYLSSTVAGTYTDVKQYAPAHMVYVGVVTRSHPTQGVIEVRIQNGFEMDELHNVSAQNPANNAILAYNTTSSLWEKNTIAGVLGYTPVPTTRTLTINGTSYDLSADRSWTISTGISGSGTTNYISKWTSSSGLGNSSIYDTGSAVTVGNTNGVRAFTVYSSTADNHIAVVGSAPSVSMSDLVAGANYQVKFGLATSNGQYAPGSVAGDFVIISQTAGILFNTNANTLALKLAGSGAATFANSVTAGSFVKSSGTASQILAADGSVITAGTGITISGGTISSTASGGVTSFNTRTGAVTLSSSDVTTALGFTPYNSTNPSGYITSSANITGTSAGVSTTVAAGSTANLLYAQIADNDYVRILAGGSSNAGYLEIATADDGTEPIYVRQYTGVFSSLTRTATLLDASGNTSFPGTVTAASFSGNASSATTADNIDGWSFVNTGSNSGTAADSINSNGISYVTGNISLFGQTDGALYSQAYNSSWQHQIYGDYRTGQIAIRGKNSGSWTGWRTVIDTSNYTSYAIARGGDDVYGIIHYVSNGNTSGSNYPLQAYSTSGGAVMSFHRSGVYAVNMGLDNDNVFRIGGWSASTNRFQMDMSGNLTMAGDVTAYSDARVKTNVKTIDKALEKILALRGVSYTRTDSNDLRTKIGVIAQETLPIVPEVVNQDNDGMYNVSYGNFAGLFIEAFKEQQVKIDKQDKVIEELKQIIHDLTK